MKKLLALAAVSAALFAGPASAQLYVGVGGGQPDPDLNEVSWKALIGTQITPVLGAEIGYHNFGKDGNVEFDAETIAATGVIPLTPMFGLVGKVGVTRLHVGPVDDTNLYLGAGVRFAMTPNVALSVEYEDFGKVGISDRVSNVGLAAQFTF